MKKLIALLLALMMCACCFVACAPKTDEPEDKTVTDSQYVKNKGKLVVGITDFAPMDYQNGEGEWVGFDADLAKKFAAKLGVEIEFVEIVWDNKVFELNGKTIDCVWNGMTLTDEVKAAMETSNAYCNNKQVLITKADVAANYATLDAVKALNVAVEAGSSGAAVATANAIATTPVENQAAALMETKSGTSQGAVIDSLMAGAMVGEGTSYADLKVAFAFDGDELYGVGFRKGSDLAAQLNAFFAECIADGSMLTLATQYGVQEAVILK